VTDDLAFVSEVRTKFTKSLFKPKQIIEIYVVFWTMNDVLDADHTRIIILNYFNAILRPKYSDTIFKTAHTT
jgi:hypothetical protein